MDTIIQSLKLGSFLVLSSLIALGQEEGNKVASIEDAKDFLGNTSSYVAKKRISLAIQSQTFDIFGKPQNPQKERQRIQVREKQVAQAPKEQSVPAQNIVDALQLTMIDTLNDQVILDGVGSVKAGQTLEFAIDGEAVAIRFEGARPQGAYFRDVRTKKLLLRPMTKLAQGILKGNQNSDDSKNIRGIKPTLEPKISEPIKVELNLAGKLN